MTAIWLSKQKLNILLFFLFVVSLPTQLSYHFWPDWSLVAGLRVDYFAPTVMISDILALGLFVIYTSHLKIEELKQIKLKALKYWFIVLGVTIFIFLNTTLSINVFESMYRWLKVLEFSFVGFWVYKHKELAGKYLPRALLVGLIYSLFLGSGQIILGKTIGGVFYLLGERTFSVSTPGIALVNLFGENYLRGYASFAHPNVLAGFSLVSLFLILELEKRKEFRRLGSVVAVLNILISFSLGAVVGLTVCLLVYFLKLYKPLSHVYKQIILCFLLVSIVLMPAAEVVVNSGIKMAESVGKRLELATIAGESFASSPLLGVGEGNFISYIPTSTIQNNLWFLQPVHNIFLLTLSEGGVVGAGLFIGILFGIKIRKNPTNLVIILPILITGLFDHYWLTINPTAFLFAIVVGILF